MLALIAADSPNLTTIAQVTGVVVSATSATIAALALRYSAKVTRLTLDTNVFLNLRDRYSKDLREPRREAARELQRRLAKSPGQPSDGLNDVMFFLEEISFHVRQDHLKLDTAASFFGTVLFAYWNSYKLSGTLSQRRKSSPRIFEDTEWLYGRLVEYERRKIGGVEPVDSFEDNEELCRRFLVQEQKEVPPQPAVMQVGSSS